MKYNLLDFVNPNMNKRSMVIGLLIGAVVLVGYYAYTVSFAVNDPLVAYKKAMREDIYGGKTPEETLRLFVSALRAGDVRLAGNYFMLDVHMSREKWIRRLQEIQNDNLLARMARDIERDAKPIPPSYQGDAGYELLNKDGTVGVVIDMEFNSFSGVWKLQSF